MSENSTTYTCAADSTSVWNPIGTHGLGSATAVRSGEAFGAFSFITRGFAFVIVFPVVRGTDCGGGPQLIMSVRHIGGATWCPICPPPTRPWLIDRTPALLKVITITLPFSPWAFCAFCNCKLWAETGNPGGLDIKRSNKHTPKMVANNWNFGQN